MKRSLIIIIAVILSFTVIGFIVNNVASKAWTSWVDYTPPTDVRPRLEFGHRFQGLADYVVVVLIDGARPDIIDRLDGRAFQFVKEKGVLFSKAYSLQPTYSIPARASISTGLPHEISGVTSNWYEGVLPAPSIFSLAKRYGLRTAAVGDKPIKILFGDYLDFYVEIPEVYGHTNMSVKEAVKLINSPQPPNLLWVGLVDIDMAGHDYGAISVQYEKAVLEASEAIIDLVKALESRGILDRTVLIILSDHGHLDRGGHGGGELEVRRIYLSIMGPMIKKGVIVENTVYYTSIAPTIAFILGLPPELVSYSPPLVDAFDMRVMEYNMSGYTAWLVLNYAYHLKSLAARFELHGYMDRITRIIGEVGGLASLGSSASLTSILSYYDELSSIYEDIKKDLMSTGSLQRFGITLLLGLVIWIPTIYILYLSREVLWKIVLSSLLGIAAFWVSFTQIYGLKFSMSYVNSLDSYIEAILWSTILSLIIISASIILLLDVKYRGRVAPLISPLLLTVAISSTPILYMSFTCGFTIKFPFPDWDIAYLYYTSLINAMFLTLFAFILPLVAFAGLTLKKKIYGLHIIK